MNQESPLRALVVDDSRLARLKITKLLTERGIEVVAEAEDGIKAVKHFNDLKPTLVTMDLILPGIDGLIAIRKIKDLDEKARILIISSCTTQEKIQKAQDLGVSHFVNKPILNNDFEEALKDLIDH